MRKTYEGLIKDNSSVVIWGTGKSMKRYINKIDPSLKVKFFADTYPQKWGTYPAKEINCPFSNILCKSKDEINNNDAVIIAIESEKDIKAVSAELDEKGISYCHITEAVRAYMPLYDTIQLEQLNNYSSENEYENHKIIKFIDCNVPFTYCNLKCSYCYIGQVRNFEYKKNYFHSPEFIRAALSRKRLGGTALINFCANGETLMCKELLPIIKELIEEGHYVSVVTNGTISRAFDDLLEARLNLNHLFIKFSFHFLELKRKDLLEVFINNVNRMRSAGCSFSVEITPNDDLIPYIDEIKELSLREFGAIPHLTIARDDRTDNLKILSKYSTEDYRKIWGTFDSKLFDFKMDQLYVKRNECCMAGEWAFHMNLETGDVFKCVGNPYLDNIYDDICRKIHLESVGCNCILPYCYNAHVYLPLGLIEDIKAPTYYEVRDRITTNGDHWVHGEIAEIFKQKLYKNNK